MLVPCPSLTGTFSISRVSVKDAIKQIGNAVPFNFAMALGQGLREAILSEDSSNPMQNEADNVLEQVGNQPLREVEMYDATTETDDVSEFGDAEEELPSNPPSDIESIVMSEGSKVPRRQPLTFVRSNKVIPRKKQAADKQLGDTTPFSEDETLEMQLPAQEFDCHLALDTSHHENTKTGFNIKPEDDIDMTNFFIGGDCEGLDDLEDLDDDSDGDEDT